MMVNKFYILLIFSLLCAFTCNSNLHGELDNRTIKNDTVFCENNLSYYLLAIKNESISKCSSWLSIYDMSKNTLGLKGPIENIIQNLLLTSKKQLECRFYGKEVFFDLYYINRDDTTSIDREEALKSLLDKLNLSIEKYYDTVIVHELVIEDSILLSEHKTKKDSITSNLVRGKYYDFSAITIENLAYKMNLVNYGCHITIQIEDASLYKMKFKRHREKIIRIGKELREHYGIGIKKSKAEIPFFIIRKKAASGSVEIDSPDSIE